jgi:hypothetical protein
LKAKIENQARKLLKVYNFPYSSENYRAFEETIDENDYEEQKQLRNKPNKASANIPSLF